MKTYLTITVLLIVLINAICVAIDKLMLNRHKPKLYVTIQQMWYKINSTKFPDLAKVCANKATIFRNRVFGKSFISSRGFILSALLSILLTSMAHAIGQVINDGSYESLHPSNWYINSISDVPGALFISYMLNYVFDYLTIYFSFHIWKLVSENETIHGVILLFIDLIIAFIFAFFCSVSIMLLIDQEYNIKLAISSASLGIYTVTGEEVLWGDALFSATTFIPTVIFTSFLLFTIIAKPITSIARSGILYFGEKILEGGLPDSDDHKNFQPFTLVGVLLSLLGAFLAFILAIMKVNY